MKKMLSLLLVFALMLSTVTSAFAADGMEGGEQPQESETQTTVTVGTLEELETAIAAAEDGDTIAISAEITLDGVALETDKDITIIRADTYESGSFFRLKNSAVLSGFTMENYKSSTTVMCDSTAEIKHCSFIGDVETTDSFIKAYMILSTADVVISDCTFSGALYSAIRSNQNVQLKITNSNFSDNSSYTQGGAIHSSGTLILDNCTFTGNKAISGGGVYCSGNLTITDCQFSGNQIESEKFGTDILSMGTLSITDDLQDGAGYFEESTGTKVELPMSEYTGTAKLIWLTDEQAAEYFAPVAPEAWYCPYVNTIANAGIVCGTGDGNFDPEAQLTWGHIITILSRFVEAQEYQLQNIQYDGWAVDAVETSVALGWITDHAAFNPDDAISRGELAYFVNYVLGLYR